DRRRRRARSGVRDGRAAHRRRGAGGDRARGVRRGDRRGGAAAGRCPIAKIEDKTRINSHIRAREGRVIRADGAQLGVMTPQDALRLAQQKDLDLVEVAPTANPPVCRIMDFGKFRYAQKKKAQESRKKSTATVLKEVKVGSQTSSHDVDFKVGHIRNFL